MELQLNMPKTVETTCLEANKQQRRYGVIYLEVSKQEKRND